MNNINIENLYAILCTAHIFITFDKKVYSLFIPTGIHIAKKMIYYKYLKL